MDRPSFPTVSAPETEPRPSAKAPPREATPESLKNALQGAKPHTPTQEHTPHHKKRTQAENQGHSHKHTSLAHTPSASGRRTKPTEATTSHERHTARTKGSHPRQTPTNATLRHSSALISLYYHYSPYYTILAHLYHITIRAPDRKPSAAPVRSVQFWQPCPIFENRTKVNFCNVKQLLQCLKNREKTRKTEKKRAFKRFCEYVNFCNVGKMQLLAIYLFICYTTHLLYNVYTMGNYGEYNIIRRSTL